MPRAVHAAALLALTALFALHAWSYLPFFYDDAFISLRYADRLVHGHGLTWTDGDRVEGYSDLLWVLACAALRAVGIDLVDAARTVCFGSALATIAALAYAGRDAPRASLVAIAFVAASGSIAVWAVAGLEATMLAAWLAWGMVLLLERRWLASGCLFALAALTRPDAVLFLAAPIAMMVRERRVISAGVPPEAADTIVSGPRSRTTPAEIVPLVLPAILAVLGQLAFRWSYYGDVVPNSAHVKLALTASRAYWGARYVGAGLLEAGGLVVLGVLALGIAWRIPALRTRVLPIAAPLAIWATYLLTIGGDPIPARRHFVPLVVLLALALLETGRAIENGTSSIPRPRAIAATALGLVVFAGAQLSAPEITQVRSETWEWRGRTLGLLLRAAFGERQPLIAVDPAGCVPYYSALPSLDMLGLNDRHIGSAPVRDFGGGPIGHERGDGRYVLGRHPDLVLFCGPDGALHPCFRSGRQMERDPRFAADYRPITIVNDAPALRSVLFARLPSENVGIVVDGATQLRIPGYFFAQPPHVASPNEDGALVLRLAANAPVTLRRVPMPTRGAWRGEANGAVVSVPSVYATPEGLVADVTLRSETPREIATITLRR